MWKPLNPQIHRLVERDPRLARPSRPPALCMSADLIPPPPPPPLRRITCQNTDDVQLHLLLRRRRLPDLARSAPRSPCREWYDDYDDVEHCTDRPHGCRSSLGVGDEQHCRPIEDWRSRLDDEQHCTLPYVYCRQLSRVVSVASTLQPLQELKLSGQGGVATRRPADKEPKKTGTQHWAACPYLSCRLGDVRKIKPCDHPCPCNNRQAPLAACATCRTTCEDDCGSRGGGGGQTAASVPSGGVTSRRHRRPPDDVQVADHRRELSILTVLLALLAIARSKCVPPLARSSRLSTVALVCAAMMCVCAVAPAVAAQMSPKSMDGDLRAETGVCSSVDIRNSVASFALLRGCRVVEGFVQILLIDHADEASYAGVSFPELREITGYLMLYRANGLRSIGALFPNLAVIRGNTLFFNHALVSYEMMHLQEIGLHSLTNILRGSVRFEKNPMLCYVDTVDWDRIARSDVNEHFIKGNRMKNECPMCPSVIANETCPRNEQNVAESLCWNRHFCQRDCPKTCPGACDKNGECCDENCLGGCSSARSKNSDNCFVCKDVKMNGKCIKKCPHGTFEYLNRRCVEERECYKMPVPKDDQTIRQNTTWKPFNDTSCILDCPPGFEEKPDRYGLLKCITCKGPCRKECFGGSVDSIASAQKLRGCTYIKGSLEIQITGGKNIVKELEENLNMIEEIEGYLKVVRSFPLISLNFLKKLRVIHGAELESNKSALVVLDNQNLQELWDWDTRNETLRIKRGRIFFHFNPKLCLYKIKLLNQVVGLSTYTDLEVATNSNGDKVACNVTMLHVRVSITAARLAIIVWDKFEHYDQRSLLGYVVYTIEAPHRNLTLYDGRDACGSDGWLVDDVPAELTTQLLTNLKPYTQYAYYVKTYMIATEDSGAQSPIQYFMTEPDVPSGPQSLKVYANSSTDLVIKWGPPVTPNGNVTYYIVTAEKEEAQSFHGERNYCDEPVSNIDRVPTRPVHEEEDKTTPNPNSCSCEEKNDKTQMEDPVQKMWSIHFEDTLHNQIYVKRDGVSRKRRSISGNQGKYLWLDDASSNLPSSDNVTEKDVIRRVVRNATVAVITGLRHYGQYLIAVRACRELTPKEKANKNITDICSITSIDTARTLSLDGADNVGMVQIEMSNTSLGMVKLMWDEPSEPNGIIITYQIEYRRMDIENHNPLMVCITRLEYIKKFSKSYTLENLLPGNYSVRVRATSLADNGAYTPTAYFLIKEGNISSAMHMILLGISVGGITLLVGALMAFYYRKKYLAMPKGLLIADVNPEYMSTVYVPDEWEVPRKKIELLKELGQGSFGMVYEGVGHDIADGQREMRCAIKTVGEHATDRERSEFLNEASVMKAFHTHHVVQLLGVVSIDQPVLVVMELMTHGDLKTYLRSHRPSTDGDQSVQPPTLKRILQMAIEIADGMAYLAAKKFVHRDLAARNCMVAEDLTVKIGDFGMTRDIYETDYYRKGTKGLLPVRWMAPESLKDGLFTSRSDVWSYGVVLWEMATLASQPYQGLSNDQVLRYVIDGGVMERPENCPDRLYELMRLCWQHKPPPRPPFLDLVTILLADVSDDFRRKSFYHSKEGCEVRAHLAEAEASAAAEDDPCTSLRISRDFDEFYHDGDDGVGTSWPANRNSGDMFLAAAVAAAAREAANDDTALPIVRAARDMADFKKPRAHWSKDDARVCKDDAFTPLHISRVIEDFSLGGSDLEDETPFEVRVPGESSRSARDWGYDPKIGEPLLSAADRPAVTQTSNGGKLGNGSAVTSPTTANGWLPNRQNGTDNSSASSQKTTEC